MFCGNCGRDVAGIVVASAETSMTNVLALDQPIWLQCPGCHDGSVRTMSGVIWPPYLANGDIDGLPVDVRKAWQEARRSHSIGCHTSTEMMCRKILMHVAVEREIAPAGAKFVHYVDALVAKGYVTTGLKDVVDQVRQRGNLANHQLPSSTEQQSLETLKITAHLLRGIYELPSLKDRS